MAFCVQAVNHCTPGTARDVNGKLGAGSCLLMDLHCWWHQTANQFASCVTGDCGQADYAYSPGAPEPPAGSAFPPDCATSGLPAGAIIVDDTTVGSSVGNCNQTWTNAGTLSWEFKNSTPSNCTSNCIYYRSKIDFHQLGGTGFCGHLWFAHTI